MQLKRINIFRWEKTWSISIDIESASREDLEATCDILGDASDLLVVFNPLKFTFECTTPIGFSYKKVKEMLVDAISESVPVCPNEVPLGVNWSIVTTILWEIKTDFEK